MRQGARSSDVILLFVVSHLSIVKMERLSKEKQADLRKCTDKRLISKLTRAGVSEDEIEPLDRTGLLNRWAELVADGAEEKPAAASGGYDPELEKQRLLLQAKQWAEDIAERRAQRELEAKRLEADTKRWEKEATERDTFQKNQLRLQARQIELMEQRDKTEGEARKGNVELLKKFGDVLRNTVGKLGDDVIEFIPFCDSIERQFKELKIPDELRVSLLKPFLNERARLLVNRLDAKHQSDYEYVKKHLMDQFRLVPQYFLETFNSLCRQSSDTYKTFVS